MSLKGLRVLEMAGLAPSPFAGMVLSDHGAEVVRVDRVGAPGLGDGMSRGKKSVQLDVKSQRGRLALLRLVRGADVLIEPFRPGVMERLGVGPRECLDANPRLVYARLTGFGQSGANSARAGHDINYVAGSGLLGMLGRCDGAPPLPPLNVAGDFAGGGLLCVAGVLMALLERASSGRGQVVDCAMVDGAAYLNSQAFHRRELLYPNARGRNLLDSGAPFYESYATSDGGFMAVGAIEPKFYALLLAGLGYEDAGELQGSQMDASRWPELKERFRRTFASRPRAHWERVFRGTDACVTPVLSLDELADGSDAHARDRALVVDTPDGQQINAAPRMSRTPAQAAGRATAESGAHTWEVLREAGFREEEIEELVREGAAGGEKNKAKAKL